jgi:hypothetical protein
MIYRMCPLDSSLLRPKISADDIVHMYEYEYCICDSTESRYSY